MYERLIWLVPLLVAILGAWRPRIGLAAFVAALPLFGSPPGGPYLGALDVAALAAVVTAWRGGRLETSAFDWPALAFVSVSLLTLVPSPYTPPSWQPSVLLGLLQALPGVESWTALYTWRAAVDLILGYTLYLTIRRAFSNASLKPLAVGLASSLALVCVLGILAQAEWIDLGSARPNRNLGSGGERLSSVFFLSGWLSQYLVFATPVALYAFSAVRASWRAWLRLGFIGLATATVILTQQRGAWLAVVVQVACWMAISLPELRGNRALQLRAARVVSVVLVLSGLLVFSTSDSVEPLLERTHSFQSGFSPRLPLWRAAAEMVEARPLLGWGMGSFSPAYDSLHPRGSDAARANRSTAHSLYFNTAAERGILGLGALGLLGYVLASSLLAPGRPRSDLRVAVAVSFAGAAVYGLVQYPFHLKNLGWLLWILLACATLEAAPRTTKWVTRAAQALICVALLWLPVRIGLFDRPALPGDHAFGLHESEAGATGSFRWTESTAAMGLPWRGDVLVLSIANGHPRSGERPIEVEIEANSQRINTSLSDGGWRTFRLEVGPPQAESLVLNLEARPAFRPFRDFRRYPEVGLSTDIRLLGVAVKDVRFESDAAETTQALGFFLPSGNKYRMP